MSDRINIGKNVYSLDYDYPKGEYTKVRVIFDERAEPVEVGTDDGRVLEINNPWAESFAEQMAQDILDRINGYYYQPFEAKGAFLPDNVELGDNVIVAGIYAPIISQDIEFNALGVSDISAPNGEDKENEFGDYVPLQDDSIKRELGRIRTELRVDYDSISASVTDLTNDMGQTLRIAADGVTITNAQGSTLTIDGGQLAANSVTATEIDATNLHVSAANIDGTLTASQIRTSSISVSDLSDGSSYATKSYVGENVTTITENTIETTSVTAQNLNVNAANVSGTLSASDIDFSGLISVGGFGYVGGSNAFDSAGAVLCDSSMSNFVVTTADATKISYHNTKNIWVASGGCYSNYAMQVYSDRRLKENVNYDLSAYDTLFDSLKPCSYRFIAEPDKTWLGMIAQDVAESIKESGLFLDDFSGVGYDADSDVYTLAYTEFVPLLIRQVQLLKTRVDALEAKYGT